MDKTAHISFLVTNLIVILQWGCICDYPREKHPVDAENVSLFMKYEAMPSFTENLRSLGLIVAEI